MSDRLAPADQVRAAGRRSVDAVTRWIDGAVTALGPEDVSLAAAHDRVLVKDVKAALDEPPFDRAAIDGVGVRADETAGASAYNPLVFPLTPIGDALPPGGAVRLNAGDPLPRGTDAVVALDLAELRDGSCEIIDSVAPGHAVEQAASHFAGGATLAAAGRRLAPHDLGVLASAGIAIVPVVRRPRVDVIVTGRAAGEASAALPLGVPDADGVLLGALIDRDGGALLNLRSVGRARAAIANAVAETEGDIVLVVGGTGPGPDDAAAAALSDAGELVVHGVALLPGETAGAGRSAAGAPVFLLPGTPTDCLWAYEFLAGRAIRRLGGWSPAPPFRSETMTAARKLVSSIGRTEICPVRRRNDGCVEPAPSFAEAGLAAATRADGFVVIAEGSEGIAQGAAVTVYLYDDGPPTTAGDASPAP